MTPNRLRRIVKGITFLIWLFYFAVPFLLSFLAFFALVLIGLLIAFTQLTYMRIFSK